MQDDRRCTVEEFESEPGDRVALMDRFVAVTLESFIEVIGQELNQQVEFIRFSCLEQLTAAFSNNGGG